MMDKFNRVGNVWIDKLDSEVDSGNQICLMDYFNRAALASIVTVSTELPLTQKTTTEDYCYRPKRSFGQGNVFKRVCHSFCSQGGGGGV